MLGYYHSAFYSSAAKDRDKNGRKIERRKIFDSHLSAFAISVDFGSARDRGTIPDLRGHEITRHSCITSREKQPAITFRDGISRNYSLLA
jgi:hypothetical protein